MLKDKVIIQGAGGKAASGGSTPVEIPNNLYSTTTAQTIEVWGEGPIGGLVDGHKSFFLDGVALQNSSGEYNYHGVQLDTRTGEHDQDGISTFSGVESEVNVSKEITHATPIVLTVETGNFDDFRVTFYTPTFMKQDTKTGNGIGTEVSLQVEVQPYGGSYTTAITIDIKGKTNQPYMRSVVLTDFQNTYGAGPWNIRLTRLTADATTVNVQNTISVQSYATILNQKFSWPDVAYYDLQIDAKQFGQEIPVRSADLYGLCDIPIPSNYDPILRHYEGIWDGTFVRAWTDNPAWHFYNLCTNSRYGLGAVGSYQLGLTEANIDKWTLYTISQYCDEFIPDGFGNYEPRYTCNAYITTQEEAFHLLNALASTFVAMPFWGTACVTFSQDAPSDVTHLAHPGNVIGGQFQYPGTGLDTRCSVASVTWNDPDNQWQAAIELVTDPDLIQKFGWIQKDVLAVGCTRRSQARRYGLWILDTERYQPESCIFKGGFDFVDCYPGCIVEVQDPSYAGIRLGGRVGNPADSEDVATTTVIPLGDPITLEIGKTYKIYCVLPCEYDPWNSNTVYAKDDIVEETGIVWKSLIDNNQNRNVRDPNAWVATKINLEERDIVTNPDGLSHTHVTVSPAFSVAPLNNAIYIVTAVGYVEPRLFRVLGNKQTKPGEYEITTILHDPNKYDRIEKGIKIDPPPTTLLPTGVMPSISGFKATPFSYAEGSVYGIGIMLSWIHSTDGRVVWYDLEYLNDESGNWATLGSTKDPSYSQKGVAAGTYDFRIRGRGDGLTPWTELDNIVISDPNIAPPQIANIHVYPSGTSYTGDSATIVWNSVVSDTYPAQRHQYYKVDVLTSDGATLKRSTNVAHESFVYTTDMLSNDFGSPPPRSFEIRVTEHDIYDIDGTPGTAVISKTTPSLAGYSPTVNADINGIAIDWQSAPILNSQISGWHIYCDTSATPTTLVATVANGTRHFLIPLRIAAQTTYYVQVVPMDVASDGTGSTVVSVIVQSDNTLTYYTDITDGNVITAGEKYRLYEEWQIIQDDAETGSDTLPSEAASFGVSHTSYDGAYGDLKDYLITQLNIFGSMTTSTTIVRNTWIATFKAYYTARTKLLSSIAAKANSNANSAQNTANTAKATTDVMNDDGKISVNEKTKARKTWNSILKEAKTDAPNKGTICTQADDIGADRSSFNAAYIALDTYLNTTLAVFANMKTVTNVSRTSDWDTAWNNYYDQRTQLLGTIASIINGTASTAIANAATAQTAAEYAQGVADTVTTAMDAVAANNKISPADQKKVQPDMRAVVSEGNPTTGGIPAQATYFNMPTGSETDFDNYTVAYDALYTYMVTTTGICDSTGSCTNMSHTYTINKVTWDAAWNNYYAYRTALLQAIATKASTMASTDSQGRLSCGTEVDNSRVQVGGIQLLTHSDDFTSVTFSGCSASSGQTAPDGTSTAYTIS
jgi:hypothetical protein